MTDLIDNIPIGDDADDLYTYYYKDLGDIGRGDIPIADCEHGSKGKVQRINVLLNRG